MPRHQDDACAVVLDPGVDAQDGDLPRARHERFQRRIAAAVPQLNRQVLRLVIACECILRSLRREVVQVLPQQLRLPVLVPCEVTIRAT